jgi:mannosyltransferase
VLAWTSAQLGDPATLVRLPAMVAGILTIPLIYALAKRCFDQPVALLASVLAALSPFLIWHSVEARAYAVTIALTLGSTLALLLAIERRRIGWWVLYGALSCAVMYSHYTGAFALIAQLGWCLWYHPSARLPALAANVAAGLLFAFWIPGVLDDFGSSTQEAYNSLVPFSVSDSIVFTKRLFGNPLLSFDHAVGPGAAVALVVGIALATAGVALSMRAAFERNERWPRPRPETVLIAALAVAGPIGCVLGSVGGTHMYLPRNFSTSLPAILIGISALALAGPAAYRAVATSLLLFGFAVGTLNVVSDEGQRPAYRQVTEFVDSRAEPGELVIEATAFPVGVRVERPDGTFESSQSIHYEASHPRVDGTALPEGLAAELLEGRYGDTVFLLGDGNSVEALRQALGLPPPTASERFGGLFELTAEEVPVPVGH